jgi:UDP-N-acetylmuramoyl-tripeptide--D-alanyl-D-alanine ligase
MDPRFVLCRSYNGLPTPFFRLRIDKPMSLQHVLERWLAQAARKTISREKPLIIGITGTVGKSTTKQATEAILHTEELEGTVRVTKKNYNNELGVPLTIFEADAPGRSLIKWLSLLGKAFVISHGWQTTGARVFVLEMGADKAGDLAYLTSIAPPQISVITAVTSEDTSLPPVHLANYPSVQALADEKSTLARVVPEGGTVILNADDPRVFAMRHHTRAHIMSYGETDAAEVRLISTQIKTRVAENNLLIPEGLEATIQCFQHRIVLMIPGVFGRSIAYSTCAALAVAQALDIQAEAKELFQRYFKPMPGRTRIISGKNNVTLFDDSYNAAPASVMSGLRDLAGLNLNPGQHKIAVIGEMRELGEESKTAHRQIGAEAARLGLDFFIPCGTLAPVMAEGALANGMPPERVKPLADTLDAIPLLETILTPGDVVLAKASQGRIDSQGVRMERVVKAFMAEPERASDLLCRQEERWNSV